MTPLVLVLAAAGLQAAAPVEVPKAVRKHLRAERFEAVSAVASLPGGVQEGLKVLFHSDVVYLADPGGEFGKTDVVTRRDLPGRRLSLAGCSSDHCLLYYER